MNTFLPPNYTVPTSGGRYMKLVDGENRLRILSSPVVGNEYWNNDNKPVRRHMGDPIDIGDIRPEKDGSLGKVKHFWAMPVWDYKDSSIKILEITQNTIQKAIKELASDEDWGSPIGYDLVINRQGEGLKTEYGIVPKPAKALDKSIVAAWKDLQEAGFDLEALFRGEDPFAPQQATRTVVEDDEGEQEPAPEDEYEGTYPEL